jgi:ribokinase
MSGRVIVVGSVNIDLVARVPHLPRPGETVTGGSYERHQGGKGGNQAVAAARLGRPTLFIGAVGDDLFHSEARRALASERVDVSMVASLPGQATGIALILVDHAGENEIAVVPGANDAIEEGFVRESLSRLGRLAGDVLLVCNEVPLAIVREALTCGRASGATTILNPAPAAGLDRSTFGLADIVTPNRQELGLLLENEARRRAGSAPANGDVPTLARALLEAGSGQVGPSAVIVTLGSSGAFVVQRPAGIAVSTPGGTESSAEGVEPDAEPAGPPLGPTVELSAGPVGWEVTARLVDTIDTTGAGDAFCGALAAALAEARPLDEAVTRAVAAGALATTRVGAREGMPTLSELDAFLASN